MKEAMSPVVEIMERRGTFTGTGGEVPIITILGVVEGEVLEWLESHGPMPLYRLIQAQERPPSLIIMAVGALIRQGMLMGNEHRLEARDDRGRAVET